MYTDPQKVQMAPGISLYTASIKEGIARLYHNPHIDGIVVDPFTSEKLTMVTGMVEYFSGLINPRMHPVDWGKGIPSYSERDLMTADELMAFGVKVVRDVLASSGYALGEFTNSVRCPANIVARRNNETYSITVRTYILGNDVDAPVLTEAEKAAAKAFTTKVNMIPCYASVGIGSSDAERFEQGIGTIWRWVLFFLHRRI